MHTTHQTRSLRLSANPSANRRPRVDRDPVWAGSGHALDGGRRLWRDPPVEAYRATNVEGVNKNKQ
eukprot:6440428-Pyramimonas_sp.AAC.1